MGQGPYPPDAIRWPTSPPLMKVAPHASANARARCGVIQGPVRLTTTTAGNGNGVHGDRCEGPQRGLVVDFNIGGRG
jgi:hypothetical protein